MKVAACQLDCAALDPAANRERTVAAVGEAAAAGARLVVLPELATSGYVLDAAGLAGVAEPADGSGPVLAAWRAAAAEHGVAVVGGFAERDGARLYDSAVAIDERGAVAGCYRKLHLFAGEKDVFAPGDRGLPVVELAGTRVGMLVCYDLRFPEAMRILAVDGAELVAVPTAWVRGFDPRRAGQVDGVLVQANLNQVFVACAGMVGEGFLGRSLVADPYGTALAGPLGDDRPGVATADADLGDSARAQVRGLGISPRADRRTDVYDHRLGYRQAAGGQ